MSLVNQLLIKDVTTLFHLNDLKQSLITFLTKYKIFTFVAAISLQTLKSSKRIKNLFTYCYALNKIKLFSFLVIIFVSRCHLFIFLTNYYRLGYQKLSGCGNEEKNPRLFLQLNPDNPFHNQSLHWLSYLGSFWVW